jgi:hypothetical protein
MMHEVARLGGEKDIFEGDRLPGGNPGRKDTEHQTPRTTKAPHRGALSIAGAGFEHLPPTLTYHFAEFIQLA